MSVSRIALIINAAIFAVSAPALASSNHESSSQRPQETHFAWNSDHDWNRSDVHHSFDHWRSEELRHEHGEGHEHGSEHGHGRGCGYGGDHSAPGCHSSPD